MVISLPAHGEARRGQPKGPSGRAKPAQAAIAFGRGFLSARLPIGLRVARIACHLFGGLRTEVSDRKLAAEHIVAVHPDLGPGVGRQAVADLDQLLNQSIERPIVPYLDELFNLPTHDTTPPALGR